MTENIPSTKEWKRLYELMIEIKEISPWEWFEEDDIFAVQDPKSKDIGFVSIMGAIGEHYSIAVYKGEKGLRKFWDFQESYSEEDDLSFQKLIEIPQLQASFEDRKYLLDEDREIIKKLGLKFRGNSAWPMFRSYKPGFVPWFINSDEAHFLIMILEQIKEVSPRFASDVDVLYPDDQDGYLLRKFSTGKKREWQDSIWHESKEIPNSFEFHFNAVAFEKLQSIPNREESIEMDIFMSPHAVDEKGERPYYPYILILIETKRGMIVAHELIPPLPNLEKMWQKMPSIIANILVKNSFLPDQIYIESEKLYRSLNYLENYLKSSVTYVEELVIAPQVRKSFTNFKYS